MEHFSSPLGPSISPHSQPEVVYQEPEWGQLLLYTDITQEVYFLVRPCLVSLIRTRPNVFTV